MVEAETKPKMTCTGSCLCGGVTFRAHLKDGEVGACHCSMCRRWSGGVFFATEYVGELDFNSTETLGIYSASDWGERGFCTKCGTSLFWRAKDGSHNVISPAVLNDLDNPKLTAQIFIDEKPDFYNFAEQTPKLTGAEVFAMFEPKNE